MWTVAWWKDVAERAFRTGAATLLSWITVAGATVGFEDIQWDRGLSVTGISVLATILFAISTHGLTRNGPSFTSVYKHNGETDSGADDRKSA